MVKSPAITSPSKPSKPGAFTRAFVALEVLVHPNIKFASKHVSGVLDDAKPKDNIVQTAFLQSASRSCYENAPCGDTSLSVKMLNGMLELARVYSYRVTEIAGGSHSATSRHYAGVGFDADQINGEAVSGKNKHVVSFMKLCRQLGATEVLGPGDSGHSGHIHAAWPRTAV
jgi:zinc D-Ala-D-Ala carboxypeptidase